ncbi:MAG: hypothetical protein EWV85_17160 [Microcystis aeruginosa Ma_QC_C_20070703_M131]|uniref:Uncharacterized protein n=1 Tax=Microcystis aeruginosa Ma_QC_C_20070703_M131 TaxID=2486263 RepID=A0A551XKS6_MICAE|nr:MAG: hypothetical protein EWV85_17160 [Microcystis aeruginosa Ma_QC_C_20070703_M131]
MGSRKYSYSYLVERLSPFSDRPRENHTGHTKSVEYRLHIRTGTHTKGGIDNQSLITGFSIL